MAKANLSKQWPVKALDPPALSMQEWYTTMALGVLFIVMAVLQLIGFSGFKDALDGMGVASSAVWGTVLILAELWAAAALFKVRLSMLFRMFSSLFALLVSGFWFYETIRLVSADMTSSSTHVGYFGRFLAQSPGWWTVLEATIVLFWTFWAVSATQVKSKS